MTVEPGWVTAGCSVVTIVGGVAIATYRGAIKAAREAGEQANKLEGRLKSLEDAVRRLEQQRGTA